MEEHLHATAIIVTFSDHNKPADLCEHLLAVMCGDESGVVLSVARIFEPKYAENLSGQSSASKLYKSFGERLTLPKQKNEAASFRLS